VRSGELTHEQNKPALLFGGTIIGVLIQTLTVAALVTSLQSGNADFSVLDGALVGAAVGVGIAAFASLSHRLFGGDSLKVWIIETANDAINLTIAGAIITYFN
jgi:ABC-type branched-subunit amino acid transport system substrate-binding protein